MGEVDGPDGWWPVDVLFAAYLAATGVLIALSGGPALLLAAHAAGLLLIALSTRASGGSGWRHWYPLLFVPLLYRETALLIPAIRRVDYDAALARWDFAIWGVHPTVWLERLTNPWISEILQFVYSLFIPAVLTVAAALWVRKRRAEFRYYAFLVSLGFLGSYVGYLLVPVRGPRFYLASLQHFELQGVWAFQALRQGLDKLESAHYDCFPSGHVALALLAWWAAGLFSRARNGAPAALPRKHFRLLCVYSLGVVVATVYLRYHYTVDVLAGAAYAAAVWFAAPHLYRLKRPRFGRH